MVGNERRVRTVIDRDLYVLHPYSEYHEEYGVVLWWHVPICEPPFVGSGERMGESQADGTPTACRRLQEINWLTHWSFLPDDRLMDIEPIESANAATFGTETAEESANAKEVDGVRPMEQR